MIDFFKNISKHVIDPARKAFTITTSDTVNFTYVTRAIYVGSDGNIVCVFPDDSVVTFTSVAAGSILPLQVKRINFTDTTATDLVGLY